MASRGAGAPKGRGSSRPGSRSASVRKETGSSRGGAASTGPRTTKSTSRQSKSDKRDKPGTGKAASDKSGTGRSGTGKTPTGSKATSSASGRTSSKPKPTARTSPARADKARPASRPAAGNRTPRALAANARQEEGSGLWRWGVIALVGLVLVVLLAPTMRSYFSQRGEISALERQVAQGEERLGQLQAEQERWRDPAYIEQQARERLKFVRPGEVSYTVIGADEIAGQQVATGQVSETRPWYDRVWASIGQADRTDVEPAP